MNTNEAIIYRLKELCLEQNLSMYALAYNSGMSTSTIKNIFNGASKNIGIITIKKICDGLNISLAAFFNSDVFKGLDLEIK